MKKRVVFTQDYTSLGMPGSGGVAAACYRAGNYVYVTGQTAFTLDGKLVGVGDPAAQARQAMDNIKTLMEMAGGKLSDVVRLVVYVTDREVRKATYPVIRQYVGDLWPCGSGIVVKGLAREEFLIEIDAYGFYADAYPYTAGATYLSQLLPSWACAGGTDVMLSRLGSPDDRARMRAAMQCGRTAPISGIPFEDVVLTALRLEQNRRWEGKSLATAAGVSGADPYEFLFDLLLAEGGNATMIVFMMSEEDVRRALRWSGTAIGSDQVGVVSDSAHVHPRAYGAFVRVLGHYVRDTPLFSLQEAVRRMTGWRPTFWGSGIGDTSARGSLRIWSCSTRVVWPTEAPMSSRRSGRAASSTSS